MDKQRRRYLYNRCNPGDVLQPDDDRYIDLDARQVRGIDWVTRLAMRIELSNGPTCQLFTGLPGSGKSTELLRLARRLEDRAGCNLFTVVVAAEETLDIGVPVDVPDVLFAILYATDRKLYESEGRDPGAAMEEGYFRRLWHWLTTTDVAFTRAEFGIDRVGKFALELKTRESLRQRVRATIGTHLHRFLNEVHEELVLMEARARALGRAGLVIILDSLEKLRGIGTTWEDVLRSAERIFADGAPYLKLPVHVLYTIPPALVSRKRFAQVDFMPMIKLRDAGGVRFEPGIDAAFDLIRQRVPERDLRDLFGPALNARIERLVDWSGGYPREIVQLLREALLAEQIPLRDRDFERLLNEVGDQYRKLVPSDAFSWLARVAVERYLTLETEGQREIADVMLSNNLVLRYLNDRDWFDVHPSVRRIPGVAAEIERLSRQRG